MQSREILLGFKKALPPLATDPSGVFKAYLNPLGTPAATRSFFFTSKRYYLSLEKEYATYLPFMNTQR